MMIHIYTHTVSTSGSAKTLCLLGGGQKTEKKKESKNEKINSKNLKIYTLR